MGDSSAGEESDEEEDDTDDFEDIGPVEEALPEGYTVKGEPHPRAE